MPHRPNILFVFSDQHNARCLGTAGHPDVQTPHLDRLAAEGWRGENVWTQNPICTPSRMSFLSSLYPSTHGYYGLYGREPQQRLTSMFEVFAEQGYRTGALGKLHTPRYWVERHCQFVYDEFIEFPKYLEGAGLYDANDNRAFNVPPDGAPSALPLEYSCEMALARQTLRFVDNLGEPADRGDDDAPWFSWICFSRPHQPYVASSPFAEMYPPESLRLPPVAETESAAHRANRERLGEAKVRACLSSYLGLVSQVDHALGQILDGLGERGQLDNTIIVYTADHGDYAGEHGCIEKRGGISARAICRIPMILRFPGRVPAGRVGSDIVEAVDLFPTLCELADLPVPNHIQGRSFMPLLADEPTPIRDSALTENPYRKAIATDRWRYVANIDGQPDELYDQRDDPWELHNRIDDLDCADTARDLQRQLLARVAEARRPVNVINGFWHSHAYDRDGRLDVNECGDRNPYW